MIYDYIDHCLQYKGISPQMDVALELLRHTDFSTLELGRYELSDGVFYNVMDCVLSPFSKTKWEYHRNYIDIQYPLAEGEQIGTMPLYQLDKCGNYSAEQDICFADDERAGTVLPMSLGTFAVFFPWDAHRPCWAKGNTRAIRKLVIKVPV